MQNRVEGIINRLGSFGYEIENSFDLLVWSKRKNILEFILLKFLGDNVLICEKLINHFDAVCGSNISDTQKSRESNTLLSAFLLFGIEEATLDRVQGRAEDSDCFLEALLDILGNLPANESKPYFKEGLVAGVKDKKRVFVKANADLLNFTVSRLKDLTDEDLDILPSSLVQNLSEKDEIRISELDAIYKDLVSLTGQLEEECNKRSCANFKEDNIIDSQEYFESLERLSEKLMKFNEEANNFIQNFPARFERKSQSMYEIGPLASSVLAKYEEVKGALEAMNTTKRANDKIIENINCYIKNKNSLKTDQDPSNLFSFT